MSQAGGKKKITNGVVAISSAAVLAVYSAGYTRTRSAATRLEEQSAERRPAAPVARPIAVPAVVAETSKEVLDRPAPPVPQATPVSHKPETTQTAPVETPARTVAEPVPTVAPPPEPKVEVTPVAAATPAAPAEPAPITTVMNWKDGTYLGWGSSRHGDIQASVVIANGRITSATIAQCLTRYSCSVIEKLPPEVPERQSPDVDYVSGATQSANAFYYAVVDALSKAK